MTHLIKEAVTRALARGYMHPQNVHKEIDDELIAAMADEIIAAEELSLQYRSNHNAS